MPTEKQIEQRNENLKKGVKTQFSGERAAEMAKKSAEVRQKKAEEKKKKEADAKTFQEIAQRVLNLKLYEGAPVDAEDIQSIAESQGQNIPVKWAVVIAQAINAIKGNKGAAEFMRDTAGEKPIEKQEINVRTIDKSLEEMENYFNDERADI